MKRTLCLVALVVATLAVSAQEKKPDRAAEVAAEIAKLEARLAELKAELVKLRPAPKNVILFWADRPMEVGQVGKFWIDATSGAYPVRVRDVIGKEEAMYSQIRPYDGGMTPFIVRGQPTAGLADDKEVRLHGIYKVVETKKHFGATRYVLEKVAEEEPPAAKPPAKGKLMKKKKP